MMVIGFALACFTKVFLAIIQAKNVQHTLYVSAFVTSLVMTGVDIVYIRLAVAGDLLAALIVGGISNACAVVSALYVFKKLRG